MSDLHRSYGRSTKQKPTQEHLSSAIKHSNDVIMQEFFQFTSNSDDVDEGRYWAASMGKPYTRAFLPKHNVSDNMFDLLVENLSQVFNLTA